MRWVEPEPDRYLGAVAASAGRRFRFRSRVGELLGRPAVDVAPPRSPLRSPPDLLYRAGAVRFVETDTDDFRGDLRSSRGAAPLTAVPPRAVRPAPRRADDPAAPTSEPATGERQVREVAIPVPKRPTGAAAGRSTAVQADPATPPEPAAGRSRDVGSTGAERLALPGVARRLAEAPEPARSRSSGTTVGGGVEDRGPAPSGPPRAAMPPAGAAGPSLLRSSTGDEGSQRRASAAPDAAATERPSSGTARAIPPVDRPGSAVEATLARFPSIPIPSARPLERSDAAAPIDLASAPSSAPPPPAPSSAPPSARPSSAQPSEALPSSVRPRAAVRADAADTSPATATAEPAGPAATGEPGRPRTPDPQAWTRRLVDALDGPPREHDDGSALRPSQAAAPSMPSLQPKRAPQAEQAAPSAAHPARGTAPPAAAAAGRHRTPKAVTPVRVGRQVPTHAVQWWGRSALRRVGLRGPR
jgi:hypothetical protein